MIAKECSRALIVDYIRAMLESIVFINTHKAKPMDFTRTRKLSFATVFTLILRRSVKSLQLVLNEYVMQFALAFSITNSAYSQSRLKLKHTAFKELFEGITNIHYQSSNYKTLFGFRIIACDASTIILPNTKEIKLFFGESKIKTQHGDLGTYTSSILECYYDVLNNISVQASLNHSHSYEVDLAIKMLDSTSDNDLLVYDRGYASYEMLANLSASNRNYIIRLSTSSFPEANMMYRNDSLWSKIVVLDAPIAQRKTIKRLGLPENIRVRFVQVILSTGEIEVLATSLLDDKYTADNFKHLYGLRWGVETFFGRIKGRLALENFTGKTKESVLQDFWSTMLLSNLESILTEDAQEIINANRSNGQLEQNINKAVAFNAIKNSAFELFQTTKDTGELLSRLTKLFLTNPCIKRRNRDTPRKKTSSRKSLNYQKRIRKHVF